MGAGSQGGGSITVMDIAQVFLESGIRAQGIDGDLLAARRWFEAAYVAGERTGDALVRAEAALGLGGLWVDEHRTAIAAGRLRVRLRQALALVDPTSAVALRLRIRLAAEADHRSGEYTATMAVLAEARAYTDPVVRVEALNLAHHCLLGPDHGHLRRELADELVGEAAGGAHRNGLLLGLLWQVVNLSLDGDPHAERRLGELRTALADEDHLSIGYVVEAIEVMLTIRAGRLTHAEQLAQACFERGSKAGHVDAPAWYGAQLAAIRWYQGRLPELLPMLADLVNSPTLSTGDNSFCAGLAVAAATAGDHRTAERLLATLRGRALADLRRSSSWLVTMYGIVEAAQVLGNAKAAARAYELLAPYAHLPIMAGHAIVCFGSVHHALGVAALTMGDADRAVTHFREAVHQGLALGHWPAVLAARQRYAEALLSRGLPDDEVAAHEQRARAGELAAALETAVPVAAAAPPAPTGPATCARDGNAWRIEWEGRTVRVDHSVGLLHLAVLTSNPGVEIAASDLTAGLDALARAARNGATFAQPVLDRTAIQQYRQRLAELREEIDGSGSDGGDRTASARKERDWVLAELAAGVGLGGRPRAFTDNGERARIAVSRAIRRSIAQIERVDAILGAHLRTATHTGMRCWYRPD